MLAAPMSDTARPSGCDSTKKLPILPVMSTAAASTLASGAPAASERTVAPLSPPMA